MTKIKAKTSENISQQIVTISDAGALKGGPSL